MNDRGRIGRRQLLAAGSLSLAGCASAPSLPLLTSTAPSPGCCERIEQLQFAPLEPDQALRVKIDEGSPTLPFDSGTSRAAGFMIAPAGDGQMLLEVTTSLVGPWPASGSVYIPAFLFHAANLQLVGHAEPRYYQNTGKLGETDASTYYAALLVPARTRHVLVYANARRLATETVRCLGDGGGGAGAAQLAQLQSVYSRIEAAEYARGRVRQIEASPLVFGIYQLKRQATGELRMRLTQAPARPAPPPAQVPQPQPQPRPLPPRGTTV